MATLKVLLVIDGLWVGGTERSLAEMLPHLVQAGITPIVVSMYRYPTEGIEHQVLDQGFDVRFLGGSTPSASRLLSYIHPLRQLISDERPDLIHTALLKANLVGRLAAAGLPVPLLNSLTNTHYSPARLRDPNIKASRLRVVQMIDSLTARYLVTHFHAVSQAVKASAVATLRIPAQRITVVERGRDLARLGLPSPERRQRARRQLGLQPEDEVVVNVGRHEYQKGQIYLLESMAQLAQVRPRLVLLVVGRQGYASAELKRFRDQAGLDGRVHFLGHRDDVPEILAAADLFVFPSLYEGLPGAVIEALALGLPIVASDIAPVREVVEKGHNALLVDPASPTRLAMAIETLLADSQRAATFGQCSREIFVKRFTLEHSVPRMLDLYHETVTWGE